MPNKEDSAWQGMHNKLPERQGCCWNTYYQTSFRQLWTMDICGEDLQWTHRFIAVLVRSSFFSMCSSDASPPGFTPSLKTLKCVEGGTLEPSLALPSDRRVGWSRVIRYQDEDMPHETCNDDQRWLPRQSEEVLQLQCQSVQSPGGGECFEKWLQGPCLYTLKPKDAA